MKVKDLEIPAGYVRVTDGATEALDLVWNKDKNEFEPVDTVNEYVSEYLCVIRPDPKRPRILRGRRPVLLATETELLLAAALKSVLFQLAGGRAPEVRSGGDTIVELYLDRFAFRDAIEHQVGTVQVGEDGNNGRDFVRLVRK
jgi:hypothetical protein